MMLRNVKKTTAKAEPKAPFCHTKPKVNTVKSNVNTVARCKSHKRSGDDLTNYI